MVQTLELVLRVVWGDAGHRLPVSAHVQPLRRQNRPEGRPVCPGSPRRKAHDCLSVCRVRPGGQGPGGRGHICMLVAVSLRLVEVTSLLRSHLERAGGSGRQLLVFRGSGQCIHPCEVIPTVHDRRGPCKMLPNPDS